MPDRYAKITPEEAQIISGLEKQFKTKTGEEVVLVAYKRNQQLRHNGE